MYNRVVFLTLLLTLFQSSVAWSAETSAPAEAPRPKESDNKESDKDKKDQPERNFYEVLEDVLQDFEYDLKNGEVTGLKDLSIRNIATSENIPPSFKNHLELLITEKILRNSKTRIIQCLPCRARRTTLEGDQVSVITPGNSSSELTRIAKLSGIAHFMDTAFSYQPNGIVLSMYITDPDSGSVIWSRSYNSETSKSSAARRGVDFSQLDDTRKQTEYTPTIQTRIALYFLFEPNVTESSGCLALGVRTVERYDNRKKEVGFEFDYMINASTLINSAGANPANLYTGFGLNLTLLFVHAWNFIGEEENYNKIRGSYFIGAGGTYASGYLGGLIRTGYEWRLGKHYGVSLNLGYRPPAAAFLGVTQTGVITGLEYGLGVNVLF